LATTTQNLALIKPAGTDKIRIAQINSNMDTIDAKMGAVGNTPLQTQVTDAAAKIAKLECLVINCGTVSSLPKTVTNSNVEDDMVVLQATLGTPAAQLSDWTVSTSNGSLTISGTISGSTTLTLYLMKSR